MLLPVHIVASLLADILYYVSLTRWKEAMIYIGVPKTSIRDQLKLKSGIRNGMLMAIPGVNMLILFSALVIYLTHRSKAR